MVHLNRKGSKRITDVNCDKFQVIIKYELSLEKNSNHAHKQHKSRRHVCFHLNGWFCFCLITLMLINFKYADSDRLTDNDQYISHPQETSLNDNYVCISDSRRVFHDWCFYQSDEFAQANSITNNIINTSCNDSDNNRDYSNQQTSKQCQKANKSKST